MITLKDLFNLSDYLILQLSYMIDTYEEPDSSIEDMPTQTLDDIIDEIHRENENTEEEETPEQNDEPNNENTDSTSDEVQDTTNDENTDSNTEEETDETPTEEKSDLEKLIERANLNITRINTIKSNAFLFGITDWDCAQISSMTEKMLLSNFMDCMSELYDDIDTMYRMYDSSTNINNRSKFIIKSYWAITSFTELVTKIYTDLNNSAYLNSINGPIEKDYQHWIDEETKKYLDSLNTWKSLDDNKWLDLIDESVQLDLKYAALLKKLVISEFKGYDDYYSKLRWYLAEIDRVFEYYSTDYVKDSDLNKILYDPSILAKVSKITMVTHVSIPFDPEQA